MRSGKGGKRPTYGQRVPRIGLNGYVHVYDPDHPLAMADGYVLQHRKVVHDAGIEVPDRHQVHHKNGKRTDNRLKNLEVVPIGVHQREHHSHPGTIRKNQFGEWPVIDLEAGERICTRCGETKPFSGFSLTRGRPHPHCKECMAAKTRAWKLRKSEAEQDARAATLYRQRGRQPWPNC